MTSTLRRSLAALLALALIATACGGSDTSDAQAAAEEAANAAEAAAGSCETIDDVTLQLQWFAQAQFAGYYAAASEGFYEARCLNVTIVEGGLETVPQQELADGNADFAISWVPRALVSRAEGLDIVNVAQVFQRSGTLQVSFKDSGINSPADLAGKKVGSWGFGLEAELFAGSQANEVEPGVDYEIVQQNFDMVALMDGEIDAAQAMVYNEYAMVLETFNPDTGALFKPDDLSIINWNDEGTAMLQDAIWADGTRLADPAYEDITTRFVAASVEGWAWCRDQFLGCLNVVVQTGSTLGESHQAWMLNEINALIWPSPGGVAMMDQALWDQTVSIGTSEGVMAEAPDADAFTTKYAEAALEILVVAGVDTKALTHQRTTVRLNEGGT